jgi:hypothetical protein
MPITVKTFKSTLSVKEMADILNKTVPDIKWAVGDGYYDGFYVKGKIEDKIKIKILDEKTRLSTEPVSKNPRYEIEAYSLGDKMTTEEENNWNKRVDEILEIIKAKNIEQVD